MTLSLPSRNLQAREQSQLVKEQVVFSVLDDGEKLV